MANLASIDSSVRAAVRGVAIDGTSSTALLVDGATGQPLGPPKMYDEAQPLAAVEAVAVRAIASRHLCDVRCTTRVCCNPSSASEPFSSDLMMAVSMNARTSM